MTIFKGEVWLLSTVGYFPACQTMSRRLNTDIGFHVSAQGFRSLTLGQYLYGRQRRSPGRLGRSIGDVIRAEESCSLPSRQSIFGHRPGGSSDCSSTVSCQDQQGPITSTSALLSFVLENFDFGFYCVRISSSFCSSPPAVLTSQRDLV